MSSDRLLGDLLAGRTAAVARAISEVENARPGFERLLAGVHPHVGRARRIGLTGPPGSGKSTLVERLVTAYRASGLSVAVVAVDPTSPFTGGARFDRILVETVGVGQSELDVARMTDSTLLVLVPESGDGIQTLKSGVMEIADIFVVNKADRPGAENLRQEI